MKSCQKHDMLLNQDWNEIRRIPSGLDKSWETRRVEGLEMMSTSLELQREKERHSCKAPTCCHTAVNKGSLACNNKKNLLSKNHEGLANANHNQMAARTKGGSCGKNGNATDSNCQQIVKCRSLSSSKKNKLSIISSPHKHERSMTCEIFPGVGGSVVGKNANHQAATSENFEMKELEEQVIELIHQLAQHKHQARLDKLSLAKLQQELSRTKSEKPMREMLKRQLEQERERREFLENKLKEMKNECCYCCPNEINVLKKENTRLNEAIQDLLPYKHRTEKMQQNNSNSVNTLETEMSKLKSQLESLVQDNHLMNMEIQKLESIINKCYQCKQQMTGHIKLDSAISSDAASNNSFKPEKDDNKFLEKIKKLEDEKKDLTKENEIQFQHYEKCLADVTSQILQALVAQKSLKDECTILKKQLAQTLEENENLKSMLNMNVSPKTLNSGSSYETSGRKHLIQEKIGGTGYEHNMQSKNRVFNIMDTSLTTNKNSHNTFNDSFATHFDYQDVSSLSGRMSLANQGGGEGLAEGKSSTLSLNEILDDVNRINEKSYEDNCAASLQFANENLNDYDADGTNESTDMVRSVEVENDNVTKKLPTFHCDYSEHSLTTMSQINFRTVELDNNFSAHHTRCLPRKSRSVNSGLMIKCNDTTSLNDRSKNILSKIANKNLHAVKHLHTDSALIDDSSFSDSISVMSTVPRDRSFILDQNKCNGALKASQRAGFDEDGNNTVKKRPTKNLFNNESAKWKNIFPLSCTKTQEEKDEGYISNKNSEGSYEIAANISSASH